MHLKLINILLDMLKYSTLKVDLFSCCLCDIDFISNYKYLLLMMLIYSLITVNFDYNVYLQKLLEKKHVKCN